MLYLFCGRKRRADIKHFLQLAGNFDNFEVIIREVDIERSETDDLLHQRLWDEIWDEIHAGQFDVAVLTPPCNTFSRARCNFQNSHGPVPVRNVHYPWGFPWLTGSNFQLVTDHNFLLSNCFHTIDICLEVGCDFLFEHPEDLGVTSSGEHPASVWQMEHMHALVTQKGAITFAIYQCHFGADSPKPTRLITSLRRGSRVSTSGLSYI